MLKKFFLVYFFLFLPINVATLKASAEFIESYNSIEKIKMNTKGGLYLEFCEPILQLNGFLKIGNKNYKIKDAKSITNKKVSWASNKKKIFNSGELVKIDTRNLFGIPKNSLQSISQINFGCEKPIVPVIKITSATNPLLFIFSGLIIGILAGNNGNSPSSETSN